MISTCRVRISSVSAVIEPTGLAFHAPSPVLSLDWSPDGAFIAVGCMGGEVVSTLTSSSTA